MLDAFAVIALLKGEPAANRVKALVERGGCALTTLGLAEVIDHLVRIVRVADEEAVLDIAQLGLDAPHELDDADAVQAALLRARHYDRRTRAVSIADCVAARVAGRTGARVATSDPHLLDLCDDERIGLIPLPDTAGTTWSR